MASALWIYPHCCGFLHNEAGEDLLKIPRAEVGLEGTCLAYDYGIFADRLCVSQEERR